jgi:chloramphenicol O-acetyltransferase
MMNYSKYLATIDAEISSIRERHYKELRPFIESKALSIKADITNNQYEFTASILYPDKRKNQIEESKKFLELSEFLYELETYHKLYFYFTVENGIFNWLD